MPVAKRNNLTKKIITQAIVKKIGYSNSFIETFIDNTFNEIKVSLIKKNIMKIKNFGVLKLIKKKKKKGKKQKKKKKKKKKKNLKIKKKKKKKK